MCLSVVTLWWAICQAAAALWCIHGCGFQLRFSVFKCLGKSLFEVAKVRAEVLTQRKWYDTDFLVAFAIISWLEVVIFINYPLKLQKAKSAVCMYMLCDIQGNHDVLGLTLFLQFVTFPFVIVSGEWARLLQWVQKRKAKRFLTWRMFCYKED